MAKVFSSKRMKIISLILSYTHDNESIIKSADKNQKCGCICCKTIIRAGEIKEFENNSAICPICGMLTVIPSNRGIEINNKILSTYGRILTEQIGSPELEPLFPKAMLSKLKTFHVNKVAS